MDNHGQWTVAGVFFEIAACFVVVFFKLHQTVSMLTLELPLAETTLGKLPVELCTSQLPPTPPLKSGVGNCPILGILDITL